MNILSTISRLTAQGGLGTMTTLTDAEVEAFRNFCQLTYDRWVTRRVIFEHADVEALPITNVPTCCGY